MSGSVNNPESERRGLAAVILAAGEGTRMPGTRAKVTYEVAGRPMVSWVVDAVREAGADPIVLVIGYEAETVRRVFEDDDLDLEYATQTRQIGTGDATACAREALAGFDGDVLVLAGDGPLIRTETIRRLVDRHRGCDAAATLGTASIDDPTGYGRIVRDADGRFVAIVEHASATDDQRRINEIYPSYACFDAALLFEVLAGLAPDAESGEYRVTDVPGRLHESGHRVELVDGIPPEDVLSINTPQQLQEVDVILSRRVEEKV